MLVRPAHAIGLIVLFLSISCDNFSDPPNYYIYHTPRSGDLAASTLAVEHVDETRIVEVVNKIIREDYPRIDGLLIFRNNKLVVEEYFHGFRATVPHNIYSAGKSVTSLLVGIAIDKGFIPGVNTSIANFLPDDLFANDPRKRGITVQHLLNMTSGLACDDWFANTEGHMQQSSDWMKFTLDLPLVNNPGDRGMYCTGNAVVLGKIIESASGMSLQDFADRYLFAPMNITDYQWHMMPDRSASAGGLFFMRPRDMGKIGLLMMNGGQWNGTQILAETWVAACSENLVKLPGPFDGYGYLWWKQSFSEGVQSYFASGNGGQDIFVVPSRNLVVVITSGNQNTSLGLQNFEIMNNYILPAAL